MRKDYRNEEDDPGQHAQDHAHRHERLFGLLQNAAVHALFIAERFEQQRDKGDGDAACYLIHKLRYAVISALAAHAVDIFVHFHHVGNARIGQDLNGGHARPREHAEQNRAPNRLGGHEDGKQQHRRHIYARHDIDFMLVEFLAQLHPKRRGDYRAHERHGDKDHRHRPAAKAEGVVDEEHEHRHDDVESDHAQKIAHHDIAELGQLEEFLQGGEKALVVFGRQTHALFYVPAAEKHDHDGDRGEDTRREQVGAFEVAEHAVKDALHAVGEQREHRRADDQSHVGEGDTDPVERRAFVVIVRHIGGHRVIGDIDDGPCRVKEHIGESIIEHLFPLRVRARGHEPEQQKAQPVRKRAEEHIDPSLAPAAVCLVRYPSHEIVGYRVPRLCDEKDRRGKPGRKSAHVDEKIKKIKRDRREKYVGGKIPHAVKDFLPNGKFHMLNPHKNAFKARLGNQKKAAVGLPFFTKFPLFPF